MTRPARILLGKHGTELSELSQLALRAWPAVLAREDVGLSESADAAYRAAESMLVALRQAEGAYLPKPWKEGDER